MARLQSLSNGSVDVVFAPREAKYDKSNISYVKLCDLPFYCVMKKHHALAQKAVIRREDLAELPVWINTIVDREVYQYIMDQGISQRPGKIIHAENMQFNIPEVASFCFNNGIFLTKGDKFDTLRPLVPLPFDPPFAVENGIYFRNDSPDYVKAFVDLVCSKPWRYSTEDAEPRLIREQQEDL